MHSPSSQPLLQLKDISVDYGPLKVVDGVNLHVHAREVVGLVGESGCGKSTLGKAIMRLVKPSGGTLLFDGVDITRMSDRNLRPLRTKFQMIFQDPFASLNPRKTVNQIIEMPLKEATRMSRVERAARVAELLQQVGLRPEFGARLPHEFSGGQRQRIGIARALAPEPRLIVCDEPVSALDVSVRAQVLNLLKDIRQRMGLALLFISHDLSVVRHIADRVAVMYLGQIVEVGDVDEIFSNPRHPYTRALLASVPDLARRRRRHRQLSSSINGEMPSVRNPPPGCRFNTRCPLATDLCRSTQPPFLLEGSSGVACHYATPALETPVPGQTA